MISRITGFWLWLFTYLWTILCSHKTWDHEISLTSQFDIELVLKILSSTVEIQQPIGWGNKILKTITLKKSVVTGLFQAWLPLFCLCLWKNHRSRDPAATHQPKQKCGTLAENWSAAWKRKSQKKSVENNQWMHKKKNNHPGGVLGNRKAIMKWSPRTFLHSSTGLHPQGSPLEASFRCKFLVSAGPHGSSMMKSPGHRWPPAGYSSWLLGQLQLLQEKGASTPAASLQMSKCLSPKNIHHKKSSKIRNSIGTTLRCWNRSWNNFRHIWPRLFHLKLHRLQPFILLGFLNPTSHLWCGLLGVKEFGNRNYVCVCVCACWCSIMIDDVWWCSIMIDDVWWCSIMIDDVWWCFLIFHSVWWCFLIFHDVWCVFMIFHDVSRFLPDISWYFTIFDDV